MKFLLKALLSSGHNEIEATAATKYYAKKLTDDSNKARALEDPLNKSDESGSDEEEPDEDEDKIQDGGNISSDEESEHSAASLAKKRRVEFNNKIVNEEARTTKQRTHLVLSVPTNDQPHLDVSNMCMCVCMQS